MRAAVTLVSERGVTAIPISDIADAADVSRQLVYQQFGDRDTLLLQAALDLIQRELLSHIADVSHATARASALAMARHFADHRVFYRALLTGSCAFALNKALTGLFVPLNRQYIRQMCGERLHSRTVEDLATFMTGGAAVVVNTWVVEGEDPLVPEEFADRLMRMRSAVTAAIANDKESGQ